MRQGEGPGDRDEALRRVLEHWEADEMPAGSQDRLLARYRREFVPRWRRPTWAPLRIALPVAVSLLLVAAAVVTRRSSSTPSPAAGPVSVPTAASIARPPAPRGSLAGFQPMDEVTATVVTESR